jgi:hypothetical protein
LEESAISCALGCATDWCFFREVSIGCSLTIRDRR